MSKGLMAWRRQTKNWMLLISARVPGNLSVKRRLPLLGLQWMHFENQSIHPPLDWQPESLCIPAVLPGPRGKWFRIGAAIVRRAGRQRASRFTHVLWRIKSWFGG